MYVLILCNLSILFAIINLNLIIHITAQPAVVGLLLNSKYTMHLYFVIIQVHIKYILFQCILKHFLYSHNIRVFWSFKWIFHFYLWGQLLFPQLLQGWCSLRQYPSSLQNLQFENIIRTQICVIILFISVQILARWAYPWHYS